MQQIKRELAKAGISYVDECLGGNIQGVRIGDMYVVEHGSGAGYYFGDLEDAGEACYTLQKVLKLVEKYWEETKRMVRVTKSKIVYWYDEKTGGYIELAGTRWDGDLSEEELMARALEEAEEADLDLSYGKILIEEEVEE